MEAEENLRKEIINYLETADDKTVRMIHAMLEVDAKEDWWDEIPEEIQVEIDKALNELDNGYGIPHEKVKEMNPQWFKK